MTLFKLTLGVIVFIGNGAFLNAQQKCPINYSERDVRCNGLIIKKCVPDAYTCEGCWIIIWPKCGSNVRGGDFYANSYSDAESLALKRQAEMQGSSCVLNRQGNYIITTDYSRYSIYMIGGKYCSLDPNAAVIRDLKAKISLFIKRYKAEISNYKNYFAGKPYKPGAIVEEYHSMLKQAEANANQLRDGLNEITDENLSTIEEEFDNLENEEVELKQKQAEYVAYINQKDPAKADARSQSDLLKGERGVKEQVAEESTQRQQLISGKSFADNQLNAGQKTIKEVLEEEREKKSDLLNNSSSADASKVTSKNQLKPKGQFPEKWTFIKIDAEQIIGLYFPTVHTTAYFSDVINLSESVRSPMEWFYKKVSSSNPQMAGKDYVNRIFEIGSEKLCSCGFGGSEVPSYPDDGNCYFATREGAMEARLKSITETRANSLYSGVWEVH
jgi:hypothetical protein